MPKKIKIALIIVITLIIASVVLMLVGKYLSQSRLADGQTSDRQISNLATGKQEEVQNQEQQSRNNVPSKVKLNPVSEEEKTKAMLAQIAVNFAERYGSYSNQSNFSNILDLKYFMSVKMANWADGYVDEQRASNYNEIYYGTTTKALKSELIKFEDALGIVAINVSCQKREASGSASNFKIYYQDLLIKFIKENGAWKVDDAIWQN